MNTQIARNLLFARNNMANLNFQLRQKQLLAELNKPKGFLIKTLMQYNQCLTVFLSEYGETLDVPKNFFTVAQNLHEVIANLTEEEAETQEQDIVDNLYIVHTLVMEIPLPNIPKQASFGMIAGIDSIYSPTRQPQTIVGSYFNRLFAARQASYQISLGWQNLLCTTEETAQSFGNFLRQASQIDGNCCSGDILDNGLYLRVYSEIPLLLDKEGTILTGPFTGAFINQLNQQPQLTDCVNVIVQRFRQRFRRAEYDARLPQIIGSYYKKLMNPDGIQVLDARLQDDQFQNLTGIFWTRFHTVEVSKKSVIAVESNTVAQYVSHILSTLPDKGVDVSLVQTVVITEFEGFIFTPTSAQYNALENRLPYLFPLPSQYTSRGLHTNWLPTTKALERAQSECFHQKPWDPQTLMGVQKALNTRFSAIERKFQTTILDPYLTRIETEKLTPIWCKLANQRVCCDLQETLLVSSITTKSRFFPLFSSTQMTFFQTENDLMIALALLAYISRQPCFSNQVKISLIRDGILSLLKAPSKKLTTNPNYITVANPTGRNRYSGTEIYSAFEDLCMELQKNTRKIP